MVNGVEASFRLTTDERTIPVDGRTEFNNTAIIDRELLIIDSNGQTIARIFNEPARWMISINGETPQQIFENVPVLAADVIVVNTGKSFVISNIVRDLEPRPLIARVNPIERSKTTAANKITIEDAGSPVARFFAKLFGQLGD